MNMDKEMLKAATASLIVSWLIAACILFFL